MIKSSCNEIDFVPTFIYVALFLKDGSTMRKVILRLNEDLKYSVIKKLVDSNGNKKRVALPFNCSIRTINRLIIKYKTLDKADFVHKNRSRKPALSFPEQTKCQVIGLYRTKYYDSNFTHFSELLKKHEVISVSFSSLKSWLFAEGILSLLRPERRLSGKRVPPSSSRRKLLPQKRPSLKQSTSSRC